MKKLWTVLSTAMLVLSLATSVYAQTGASEQNQMSLAERKWVEKDKVYYNTTDFPSSIDYDDGKGWMGTLSIVPDKTKCGGTNGTTCVVVYAGFAYYQY